LLFLLSACGEESRESTGSAQPHADENTVLSVVASEELILALQPRLKALVSSKPASGLFAPSPRIHGISDESPPPQQGDIPGVEIRIWNQSKREHTAPANGPSFDDLLTPLRHRNLSYNHAKFSIISGTFDGDSLFRTSIHFEGLAEAATPTRLVSVESDSEVIWQKGVAPDPAAWLITSWKCASVKTLESPTPLFEEVLADALPDRAAFARARTSRHQQILLESYFGGKPANLPKHYSDSRFYPDSVNIHPALSVVDIDGDGFDDIFVCVRWGKSMLLRNRGDGSFEESAASVGLDIDGRNTSATFADFDNDGDPDLMLGRSLEQSWYLENLDGKFVRRPDAVAAPGLPWLVTATSAVDYNGDGLLDVYFCTYSPLDINTRLHGDASGLAPEWARKFLPDGQADEVVRRSESAHSYLAQVGPPNVLFVNRGGGRFEVAPESPTLAGWRNTFQAAWSDHDGDGDPDLYIANDFAPDHFYRNDGKNGFTEITAAAGLESMGFAMGASWGDYDNDGHEDLYVSNMYSKAGRRITKQIQGLDPRFGASADGNSLFQNTGPSGFRRVSGNGPNQIPVSRAGWSWGGQFTDFDNDGFLDLYVSSGFYSPPARYAIDVDL
jgi:hypothetical protein